LLRNYTRGHLKLFLAPIESSLESNAFVVGPNLENNWT